MFPLQPGLLPASAPKKLPRVRRNRCCTKLRSLLVFLVCNVLAAAKRAAAAFRGSAGVAQPRFLLARRRGRSPAVVLQQYFGLLLQQLGSQASAGVLQAAARSGSASSPRLHCPEPCGSSVGSGSSRGSVASCCVRAVFENHQQHMGESWCVAWLCPQREFRSQDQPPAPHPPQLPSSSSSSSSPSSFLSFSPPTLQRLSQPLCTPCRICCLGAGRMRHGGDALMLSSWINGAELRVSKGLWGPEAAGLSAEQHQPACVRSWRVSALLLLLPRG